MQRPTIGALFAGYGGLDLGVRQVIDADLAWYAEVDKGALKILEHRFPGVPNLRDVTTVDWAAVPRVDILTGGSPCQDLSHAGRRKGMTEGTRSNLWVAMREAIAQLRPRLVIWENVRGAYSAPADSDLEPCPGCVGGAGDGAPVLRALGRVLGDLSDLGYDACWHGLPASSVGAPHGRFRVFVVARPADADGGGPQVVRLLHTPEAKNGSAGPDYARAGRPNSGGDDLVTAVSLLPTPAVNDMGEGKTVEWWDEWTETQREKHGNGNGHGKSLAVEAQRLLPTPMTAYTSTTVDEWKARRPAGNGARREAVGDLRLVTEEMPERWGDYAPAIHRWEQARGVPAPPPTEPGPRGNPRLSARFPEWMMGLPPGWVTDTPGITRNEALKALGNGVVPQQAAAAIRTMLSWYSLT